MELNGRVIPALCFQQAMGSMDRNTLTSILLVSKEWSAVAKAELPSRYGEYRFGVSTTGTDISPENLFAIASLMDSIENKETGQPYEKAWATEFDTLTFHPQPAKVKFVATYKLLSAVARKYSRRVPRELLSALIVKYATAHRPHLDLSFARAKKDKRMMKVWLRGILLKWTGSLPRVFQPSLVKIRRMYVVRRSP